MNILTFLVSFFIFLIGSYLIYKVYKRFSVRNLGTISLNSQTGKVLEAEAKKIKARNSTQKFLENIKNFTFSLTFLKESDKKMENLRYYAKRLNIVWNDNILTAEDFFAIRALFQLSYIIIISIVIVFGSIYFAPLLFFYRFPGFIIDFFCEQEIKDRNAKLLEDFRDFYAEFFYNYRHKANRGVKITEVAMRFYSRANDETKLLIDNLRADSTQSEEYALEQMKDLFRVVKIHRMADQIKMIIMGKTLNTDAMEGFKREIEEEFRAEKKKELEFLKFKAQAPQIVAWIILTEIVFAVSLSSFIKK